MVTVVFTEVLGGARLAGRQLGTDEVHHTIERYLKRIETAASSFRGRTLHSRENQNQVNAIFPTLSEATLATLEIQHRVADLPPVSGVRLNVRIGMHEASSEQEAKDIALQLMSLALPEQILCGREISQDQIHKTGVEIRDLHQIKLKDGRNFQVVELLWRDDDVPVSLTATSVLSLADLEDDPFIIETELSATPNIEPVNTLTLPEVASKLSLRYEGRSFLLDEKTPFVTIGRERNNDVAINDSRVSRQHARIERKDGRYFLVDMSTNGTFVHVLGQSEIFLRKENICLRHKGSLSFGASISKDAEAKKLEFEFL